MSEFFLTHQRIHPWCGLVKSCEAESRNRSNIHEYMTGNEVIVNNEYICRQIGAWGRDTK